LANWPIPVGDLANTGWRFQIVGDGTFWNNFAITLYEDIYIQSCFANYLLVEGSISFWKKVHYLYLTILYLKKIRELKAKWNPFFPS